MESRKIKRLSKDILSRNLDYMHTYNLKKILMLESLNLFLGNYSVIWGKCWLFSDRFVKDHGLFWFTVQNIPP